MSASINDQKSKFLDALSDFGGYSGNVKLRAKLSWPEEEYWTIHSLLLDEGLILRGRGKGGSVRLLPKEQTANLNESITSSEMEISPEKQSVRELDLYEPMRNAILSGWTKERGFDDAVVEITALPGRRNTGGAWTRPDLAVLAVKTYPYLPGRKFEIITFEAKKSDSINVLGVFEALSHQQFATISYVIFYTDGKDFDSEFTDTDRILSLAKLHGVGVIVATDASDYKLWEEVVEPRRSEPDPEQANRFIATSFSEEAKDRLVRWHK